MTRSMTRWMLAGLMALAALSAVGAPAQADLPENPFAGNWSGTWTAENGVVGTFDWTISDAGRISGTAHSTTNDLTGALVGHVGADGNLEFVGFVPDDVPSDAHNGFPFEGTAVIDGDGKLVVSVDGQAPVQGSLVAILERN